MKAKDMADMFNNDPDTLAQICQMFVDDTISLTKQRNPKTDSAALAIIREMERKWSAFAERTNGEIVANGYEILLRAKAPGLYEVVNAARRIGIK